jgi:hypothetical protein
MSIENDTTEAECLALLRSQIAAMVAKGNRQIWRNQQIAGQLTTYLSQILQIGKQAIATVKMSETERQQAWQKAKKKLSKAHLDWDVIQNQLERRRIECDLSSCVNNNYNGKLRNCKKLNKNAGKI